MPTLQATVMTALLPIGVPVRRPRRVRWRGERLVLGERTVASHLTHVYAKLGVRSRTELARRLGDDEPASAVKTRADT